MKKLLLICSTVLLPLSMWAASFTYENIIYNVLDDTTCEVGDNKNNSSLPSVVIIPENVYDENDNEYTVIGITSLAFCFVSTIQSITIPATVTYINLAAFYCCYSLKTIYSLNPEPPKVDNQDNLAFSSVPSDCILYVPVASKDAYASAEGWSYFSNIEEIETGVPEEDTFEYEGISYRITSTTYLTVEVGSNENASGDIVIPNIAYNNAFEYTVEGIGKSAFKDAELTSVTISERLSYIEESAFSGCTSLTMIYSLNPEPPMCGDNVFDEVPENCTLYVPQGSKETYASADVWSRFANNIAEDVFEYEGMCYHITSIADNTVETTIISEDEVYSGKIVIPETVKYEDIPYTVTGIGDWTFNASYDITSLEMPKTITYVGDYAFSYCTWITTLTIPSNITRIGMYAYRACTGITDVVIEYGEEPLCFDFGDGGYTFYNCSIKKVYVNRDITWDRSHSSPWEGMDTITEFEIGEYMTTIPTYMCYNLVGLKEIIIPDNITEMGEDAYFACKGATKIRISKNLISLPPNAFVTCSSLTEVELPDNITEIGYRAFYDCTNLSSVTLPSNLITIDSKAFSGCNLSVLTIPEQVTNIGQDAFSYNSNLVRVVSLNSTPPTPGGSDIFAGIDEQCVLYVPNESKELYSSADVWKDFYEIHGLSEPYVSTLDATYITRTTATLNGTVEFLTEDKDDITEQGFEYWIDEDDVMTATATDVDGEDISALIQDLVENKNYTYRAYAKTESDTYYGRDFVFSTSNRNGDFCVDGIYYNYGEEEGTCVVTYRDENYNYYSGVMEIPESVLYNNTNYTVVGVGTWAFYESPELTEVTIPNTITDVANQAFNGCDALVKATIGSSVETIGNVSFNCPSLLELISLNPTPPTCNEYAFRDVDKSACALTVPEGSEDAYAAADVWKDFFPTDDDTTGIDSILVDNENVVGIYSTSGQKLNTTVKGVNIIRYTDGTVKKVYVK